MRLTVGGHAQSGMITTYAGPGLPVLGAQATRQAIDRPTSVIPDNSGGFYVASQAQNRIDKVAADGLCRLVTDLQKTKSHSPKGHFLFTIAPQHVALPRR